MSTTKKTLTSKAQGVIKKLAKRTTPATAKVLGTTSTFLSGLVTSGHLKVEGTVKSGGRGRPSNAYVLTAKGRKVAA